MAEYYRQLKSMKFRKAPGPDGIIKEWLMCAPIQWHEICLSLLNDWWENEIPEDELKAKIVLIYKKR